MAESFKLSGGYKSEPIGTPSGQADLHVPLDEQVTLSRKTSMQITLIDDNPSSVPLSGISSIAVLAVKAVGGKVRVRLTSADGSSQAVPVDGLLILTSLSVPITAVDLTRVASTETQVHVFMGERA